MSKSMRGALVAIAFMVGTGTGAQEPEGVVIGTWQGTLDVQGTQLRIVFHVARGEDGSLTGTMDSPDQGAYGISLTGVSVTQRTLTLEVAGLGVTYTGSVSDSGGAVTGTFTQGPMSVPLELARSEVALERPARPQEPKPPLPYTAVDVTFSNPDANIELAGTLTAPRGEGAFPGVVLVSGSGRQDRDESLMGHKPFLVLSDHLTRQGVVVLRYDDRGVGASEGDFATATSRDFTSDALAAVAYLRQQPQVAPDRVGIAGHSEGGLIAPMAAGRSDEVAFIVMLAGPGVPGIDVLVAQGRLINRAAGTPEEVVEMNARVQTGLAEIVRDETDPDVAESRMRALLAAEFNGLPPAIREAVGEALSEATIDRTIAQFSSPWFRFFLHHDPRPVLEDVSVPVLSLIGEKDLQVPPELNGPEIEAALRRGGNADATVRTLPGLNHLFQEAETGSPSEYQRIEETMNAAALEAVSSWILERFGSPR